MKRIIYLQEIRGITAIVEEITEEVSPRVLAQALVVAGPGIIEREYFTSSEVELFLNEIPFKEVNRHKKGVFFLFLSEERIICLRSTKDSDTEVMCPLSEVRSFARGDVVVTKMKSQRK